jgi:four helix bundle protein
MGSGILRLDAETISQAEEASRARSDTEFCSKLDGALQEADESQLWLELLRDDCGINTRELQELLIEIDELIAVFVTMSAKTKRNQV